MKKFKLAVETVVSKSVEVKNLDLTSSKDVFRLFDEIMEAHCYQTVDDVNTYRETLTKIGEWIDEARKGYDC